MGFTVNNSPTSTKCTCTPLIMSDTNRQSQKIKQRDTNRQKSIVLTDVAAAVGIVGFLRQMILGSVEHQLGNQTALGVREKLLFVPHVESAETVSMVTRGGRAVCRKNFGWVQ